MYVFKRTRKLPDGTVRADATYSYRFEWQGKQIPRKTAFTNAADAESAGKAHLHALQVGAYDIAHALRRRRAPVTLPLSDVVTQYTAAPPAPRRANADTRENNVNALRSLLRAAGRGELETIGAEALKDALVWDFKAAIEKKAAGESEERQQQIYRSANSLLRQARSLFSKDMLEYYARHTSLKLPDLQKFLAAPGFKGVTKLEYDPPPDAIVVKTFESLDNMVGHAVPSGPVAASPDARNIFVACWLAIGFGLRASEIKIARRNWFIELDGAAWCAGTALAKNKKFPRVRAQFGAWEKLAPFLQPMAGDAFVLHGTVTERTETVFRRISEWMRGLGWQTQHHVHELRAWAGCQIAERSERGLLDAQTFLRHAHFTTTEKFYGHHMKRRLGEIKLQLPTVAAVELKVVNGGAQ